MADPERLRADIATERERAQAEIEALEKVAISLDASDPERSWARLVAEWGLRYFADSVDQLDRLAAELDRLGATKGA